MTNLILGLIFLILACFGIVLKKTYFFIPAKELKRRAENRDHLAEKLYTAVSYGDSLRALFWLYIGLTAAVSFVLFARQMPIWISLLVIGPLVYIIFSLIPASRVTRAGMAMTSLVSPIINMLLIYLDPLLSQGSRLVEKHYKNNHTGIFEHEDLLDLIDRQQSQQDSRLSQEELDIVKRAVLFSDRKVVDVLTPRKQVKTVLAEDTIGPILINELHESNQEHVLVKEDSKGEVVGTLAFKDLNVHSHGKVKDLMKDSVYYLNEDDSLREALHGFFVTNQPMFVVINSFEEYVGVITIENILKELLGHIPGEDFEDYSVIEAVAAKHSKKPGHQTKTTEEDEASVKTDDEVLE